MSAALADDLTRLEAAHAALLEHPLSSRKAWLVAVLLDNFCDAAFAAWRGDPRRVGGAEDVLRFRADAQAENPAVATIAALCAGRADGPRLETRAVKVPIPDYASLPISDYMVSLYNGNTVQRLQVVLRDGTTQLAPDVLAEALAYWQQRAG